MKKPIHTKLNRSEAVLDMRAVGIRVFKTWADAIRINNRDRGAA